MSTLYILCGPSGCGKSTWAHNFISETERLGGRIAYVSRDEIRYSIVSEEEDYFSHEKEVFKHFVKAIVHYLPYDDVIADATHLNEFSRRKLTQAIDAYYDNYEIVMVVFDVDANTCIERNKNREGRANVPDTVIRNMCRDFRAPTLEDDDRIIEIKEVV